MSNLSPSFSAGLKTGFNTTLASCRLMHEEGLTSAQALVSLMDKLTHQDNPAAIIGQKCGAILAQQAIDYGMGRQRIFLV